MMDDSSGTLYRLQADLARAAGVWKQRQGLVQWRNEGGSFLQVRQEAEFLWQVCGQFDCTQ